MNEPTPLTKAKPHPTPKRKCLHIYTYGYCCKNNKRGSRSAIGVYIRDSAIDSKHNVSCLTSLYRKQTSEVASLLAVQYILDAGKHTRHPLHKYVVAHNVQMVVHVDTKATADWCNKRGDKWALQGYPTRPHIELLREVHQMSATLQTANTLHVCPSTPNDSDHQSTLMAKRLAKSAVERAIVSSEKEDFYLNSHFGICVFDDGPRYNLEVPPHEHSYASSKGAWWDDEQKTFFVYEHDVGCHYDMRRTDWLNLRKMYDADDIDR